RDVARNRLFEVTRLRVEGFEFLVQRLQLCLELLVADGLAGCHAHVPARIERPALRLDVLQRYHPTQAEDVRKFRLLAEDLSDLRLSLVAAKCEVEIFAAIETDDVGEEADLRGCPIAVRAVDLPVDVPGINEED